jgi:hypothetical protein
MKWRVLRNALITFLLCGLFVAYAAYYPTPFAVNIGGTNATSQTTNGACYYDGSKITCPGALPIAKGGTGATSQTTAGACYYDGSKITCPGALPPAQGGTGGILPVANGGTGDTGTAWASYTPTITCASGSLTTLAFRTGQWKQIGKTVHVRIQIGITTNGTCAGAVIASMPTPTVQQSLSFNTGDMVGAVANGSILRGECCLTGTQNMYIYKYDGTYPGADGAIMSVSGTYERT